MNRMLAIFVITLASLAATSANAQRPTLKANIPFDFTIGDTWMPAGEYMITSPFEEVLVLRSAQHTASVVSSKNYAESQSGSELVFEKYGDAYFLHAVLCPSVTSLNLQLAPSRAEKSARQHSIEAKLTDKGEQVLIAAR